MPSPNVAVTLYEPDALLLSVSVVRALPLLFVVPLVVLNDAVPLFGIRLNVIVSPDTPRFAPSLTCLTEAINVTASPGWKGVDSTLYRVRMGGWAGGGDGGSASGGDGGGGDGSSSGGDGGGGGGGGGSSSGGDGGGGGGGDDEVSTVTVPPMD